MRVLVLGGYGLIGLEIVRALRRAGIGVTGFGRSRATGRRLVPDIRWIHGDMRRMLKPEDWAEALHGIEVVVNAAGALQDGPRDNLKAVHDTAIRALIAACGQQSVSRFVQISAPGAVASAPTAFLATKAAGDAALRGSGLDWTILKPGLVMSTGAYGGTTLLRMLAAFPVIQPIVLSRARIQTVSGADVGEAVRAVLAGEVASRQDYDLVEEETHTLGGVVKAVRLWSGRPEAREWALPRWLGFALARGADLAGLFGWRSPLRTTALKSLEDGVTGDANDWRRAGGFRLKSLDETLRDIPATAQERTFGRAQLVFPVLLMILAAFWLASGIVGFLQRDAAAAVLGARVAPDIAQWLVAAGIVADLLIGWGLLWRRWVRRAAWASILVSLGYLAMGTWLTPELWADPLGPFVKVFPAMALALAVAALVEDR